jgi:phosphatidylserine/phosphatidylglycerophosphate/cardiolipin synthase-like enzyme
MMVYSTPLCKAQADVHPGHELLILNAPDRRKAVVDLIRGARSRLVLSVFRCQDFAILDEIAAAIQRKVRVTALLTPSAKNWDKRLQDLGLLLESMGAEMHRYAGVEAKYHAKYLVADAEVALVASLNFTRKCFERTCDFILITRDAGVVSSLTRIFESDCGRPPAPLPSDLSPRLIVGPECARSRFCELIAKARKSIRIIDHRVRDSQVVTLLQEREAAGVAVEILGQGDLAGMTSHGKMMLVDEEIAVIGSASLAKPSLNHRREIAVMIDAPELVCELGRYFGHLSSATPGGVESAPSGDVIDEADEEDAEP